jgi:DNA-directed RNA polymerase subunit RPC12/RpoP
MDLTGTVAPGATRRGGAAGAAGIARAEPAWRRIERRDERGVVTDWVEVGQCSRCGRGVDRAFPVEYRTYGGEVVCRGCSPRLTDRLAAFRPG